MLRQHLSFRPLPRTIRIYRRQLNEADNMLRKTSQRSPQLALLMTATFVIAEAKTAVPYITL